MSSYKPPRLLAVVVQPRPCSFQPFRSFLPVQWFDWPPGFRWRPTDDQLLAATGWLFRHHQGIRTNRAQLDSGATRIRAKPHRSSAL